MVGRRQQQVFLLSTALALVAVTARADDFPVRDDASTCSAPGAEQQRLGAALVVRVGPQHVGYVRFDVSRLAAGTAIEKATLSVFLERVNAPGVITVRRLDGPWSEDNLTHANRPPLGSSMTEPLAVAADAATQQYLAVDVTDAVRAWLSGATNHGLALVGDGTVDVELGAKEKPDDRRPMTLQVVTAAAGQDD